jgi:hypothetical protein
MMQTVYRQEAKSAKEILFLPFALFAFLAAKLFLSFESQDFEI